MPVLPAVPSTTVPPGLMLGVQGKYGGAAGERIGDVQSSLFGIPNDPECSTILDTAAGILEFCFTIYMRADLLRQALQVNLEEWDV